MERIYSRDMVELYDEDRKIAAITTNIKQMFPDWRDGLKSVQRRGIYALYHNLKSTPQSPFIKVAEVTGITMGKYHPHGNAAISDAIVLMATDWNIKYPYIEGYGNFGTVEGDAAASERYIECRLSQFALDCIIGSLSVCDSVVNWTRNYSDTTDEPEYLPAIIPNLLINGIHGIGVGMVSMVPRHNLGEVIDALIEVIKNPDYVPILIPDHCMPVDIVDTDWEQISRTGHGNYKARARIDIETDKKGHNYLIIKSVPDRVTLYNPRTQKGVIDKILLDINKDKKYPEIDSINSETDKEDLRFVIRLKDGYDPNYVKEMLYKTTLLEQTYVVNNLVIDNREVKLFSYNEYLNKVAALQRETLTRMYMSIISSEDTNFHRYNFYLNMMTSGRIDEFISDIRKLKKVDTEGKNAFLERIIKKYKVSDIEAKYITSIDVLKLADGYIDEYREKRDKAARNRDKLIDKIMHPELMNDDIIDTLLHIKAKYNKPRLCTVIHPDNVQEVPSGMFKIIVTENNFIRKVSITDAAASSRRSDPPKYTIDIDNRDNVLIFDRKGKVFKLPVNNVMICERSNPGIKLAVMIKNCVSDIVKIIPESVVNGMIDENIQNKQSLTNYLAIVTKNNCIKKIKLSDLNNISSNGTAYSKLAEGDSIADISILTDTMDIVVYSSHKALRLQMSQIPEYRRMALGVKAMSNDLVIDGVTSVLPNTSDIIVVTKDGHVNRFPISAFKYGNRGNAGSSVIKLTNGNEILSIYGVCEINNLYLESPSENRIVPIADIPICSTISTGTKMMKDGIIKSYIC